MPETCARLWNIKVQEMWTAKATEELRAVPKAVAHNMSLHCSYTAKETRGVRIRPLPHLAGGPQLLLNDDADLLRPSQNGKGNVGKQVEPPFLAV